MKLYATVTSDKGKKASKSSNKHLVTRFFVGNNEVAYCQLSQLTGGNVILKCRSLINETEDFFIEVKSKKQKGEVCYCGSSELPTTHTKDECKNPF